MRKQWEAILTDNAVIRGVCYIYLAASKQSQAAVSDMTGIWV